MNPGALPIFRAGAKAVTGRPAQLVIVGAIHIAIPLHRLAKLMGYRVTVVDARAKFATKERFPEADELIVAWPDEAMAKLDVDADGRCQLDQTFFLDFGDLRPHQVHLEGGDASSDSYCFS